MIDFTLAMYRLLLSKLWDAGYAFATFEYFLDKNRSFEKVVVLRHDVDKRPFNALKVAEIEHWMGIRASYYFRTVKTSFDEEVIRKIAGMGHEIGYHYENLSEMSKTRGVGSEARLFELAFDDFKRNLEKLRTLTPVKTICMHGSPLSNWDNRNLWKRYDYHDYGIIGEPYFDIDFVKVLYITDTGRRWDGDKVSVRDKASADFGLRIADCGIGKKAMQEKARVADLKLRKTYDIIEAVEKRLLPDKIMINTHPQRWTDRPVPWAVELILQNIKNLVKRFWRC